MIRKVNYILNKKQKLHLVILFLIISIGTFLELLGVTAIMPFVQAVVSPEQIMSITYLSWIYNTLKLTSERSLLILMAFFLIIVYVVKNIYLSLMYNIQFRFVANNQRRLACKMMACYLNQTYEFHLLKNSSELIRNIANDATMFYAAILAYLQLFTELSVCAVLSCYLLIKDKTMTIGVVLTFAVFAVIYIRVIKKRLWAMGVSNRENQVLMMKWIQQAFGGIKELKVLGREQFFLDRYDESYEKFAETGRKNQLWSVMPRTLMEALCISGLMLVVIFKLYRGVYLEYFIPTLSVFAVAAFRMLPSFGRIAQYINNISYNSVAVNAVYEELKEIDDLLQSRKQEMNDIENMRYEKGIFVKNLSYRYPNVDRCVLDDITYQIPKNKSVAIVGTSGAGKTTMADILLGILDPTEGVVLADDKNIHKNKHGWNKMVGYIPQTIYLMDDTLRNNIAFGLEEKEIDDKKIWQVIEDAQLKEFVSELEDGIYTKVGERGVRLSGGQRQRIGIARALYNEPQILVLDEATSALDNDTESAVMEAIERLAGKKTIIIIAHRLSTIENCDLVFRVENGKVLVDN